MATQRPRPDSSPTPPASERLDSWKEIAAYLKRDLRTVQRWEKSEGLPALRHFHGKQGSVYAYKAELDAWWNNRRPHLEKQEQVRPVYRRWLGLSAAAAIGLVVLAGAAALVVWRQGKGQKASPERVRTVAVLPFENLSHDREQDYFADGMTDDLITDLGRMEALRVISRTSVMAYKGTEKPLSQIGRELGADDVVEGTIVQSGKRVRITAQLIETGTDRHMWANRYEGDLRDVVSLQDDVAGAIAGEIQGKLIPGKRVRLAASRPIDPEAHEAYLKGRYFWNKRTEAGLKKAIELFNQAIERDPGYAVAYTGLADSYNLLSVWGALAPRETFPKAQVAALKALELDGALAEAHTSLAFVTYRFDWDWKKAEEEFQQAIKLNPNYATGHHWYGEFLNDIGRFDQGIAELKQAQQLDPLSFIVTSDLAVGLVLARRYDAAIQELQKVLEMDPNFAPAHLYLGSCYTHRREFPKAIAEFEKGLALSPGDATFRAGLADAYARSGKKAEAEKLLQEVNEQVKQGGFSSFHTAAFYAHLGEKDQAFAWLQKAYDEHSWWLVTVKVEPSLDPLRSDPRFQKLLGRIGLPP